MATPSLGELFAAAANAVNAARATQREGEPLKLPIYAPVPGEEWTNSHTDLPALRQWSHPFGSKADPLRQLTELANAKGGYYPLGRNGVWHTGVHFDAGTAGILDQSFVRCLADGEVVAYRVDTQSPSTEYTVNRQLVQRTFARNFVLVRHRLQAPKIAGSDEVPPGLTFYSLYLHLQDWSAYQADPSLKRPAFWPPGKTLRVKDTEHDHVPGLDGLVWLRTRIGPNGGAVISGLARGTEVTVSGTGSYRKLENLAGPRQLLSDGALQGYVSSHHLALIGGNDYRATHELDVLADPAAHAQRLMKLPTGTEVRISGEGAYRKLEWVNQYVHFASLHSEPEPQERDCYVVLDEPVPIKAGALIGHLGQYHKCFDEQPTQQLHLEVFSGENVGGFIHFCREWAKRLPASGKTWLQVPKGTPIAPHQDGIGPTQQPILADDSPRSAADLYLPKSLLDGLKPEDKFTVPALDGRKAFTWYRLDNLLHDEHNQLQQGWVKVWADAQWVSPWEWPGYDVIYNRDTPQRCLAYRKQPVLEQMNEKARERYSQMADLSDQGPVRSRLFEIIDRDRNGRMTADELQQALTLPAHAQSISRLVIHCENEWHWHPQKWNGLDEILGHTPSTPHTNWFSGKRRIEQLCWWNEVAGKVGLPVDGRVWHFHPLTLGAGLSQPFTFTLEIMRKLYPGLDTNRNNDLQEIANELNLHLEFYKLDTQLRRAHFFAQILQETGSKLAVEEKFIYSSASLKSTFRYFRQNPEIADTLGYLSIPGIKRDGSRMTHVDFEQIANRAYGGRNGNGEFSTGDGWKYRGRGLKQLTGRENYKYLNNWNKELSSNWPDEKIDFLENPDSLIKMKYAARSAAFFWIRNHLYYIADRGASAEVVDSITQIVNSDTNSYPERRSNFSKIWSEGFLV